jgi:Domain of unknown function (DUF4279)
MARITVWLFIECADLTVEEISAQIGLKPDRARRIGDPRGKTGKAYEINSWSLESVVHVEENPLTICERVQQSLDEVLRRIEVSAQRFRSLSSGRTAGIYVGISANENPALELKAATISAIADLGVGLEIDLMTGD